MKHLALRTVSGTVYIAIILAAISINHLWFFVTFLVLHLLSLHEFYTIIKKKTSVHYYIGLILSVAAFTITYINSVGLCHKIIPESIILIPLVLSIFISEIFKFSRKPFHAIAFTLLGLLYITVPFSLLAKLAFFSNTDTLHTELLLGIFLFVWSNDTFAYIFGSLLGKHPLYAKISPKKSVEGFVGGLTATILLAVALSHFSVFTQLTMVEWTVGALIIVVFATFGDLAESMLKRYLTIKDSGNIMPGHGGFLDRFDSLLFAIPAFYTYLTVIKL